MLIRHHATWRLYCRGDTLIRCRRFDRPQDAAERQRATRSACRYQQSSQWRSTDSFRHACHRKPASISASCCMKLFRAKDNSYAPLIYSFFLLVLSRTFSHRVLCLKFWTTYNAFCVTFGLEIREHDGFPGRITGGVCPGVSRSLCRNCKVTADWTSKIAHLCDVVVAVDRPNWLAVDYLVR